ncbi:DUF3662 and FHA domain-containing protein [Pseudarthrobacter sp. PS3-L1]|uniref:FhaA domain-containing protein n=1 Tax=Pseudarthrobacter sp. PS3-L1 TaxID=3046207 RepID=UPI0024B8F569|nr:DUF3662 and FHA domain-containing protein [Pseudarthrobacter sp. PS3-L1]MDJ0320945.1 DUF3662 and FHA domain-containing protein [Pseudarthrobacter sp. PS3-L1]
MGLLDNVERGIEKAVRGVFSTGSKAQVEPVEIASRLRREVDNKSMTISAGRTLVPNVFDVQLSDADFGRAQEWGTPLAEELCDVVINHVHSQGYTLQGPVQISFRRNSEQRAGNFDITARTEKDGNTPAAPPPSRPNLPAAPQRAPARLQPVLDIDGQRYSLNAPSIVLGRSSEADILVDDTGVSRRHLEIRTVNGLSSAVDMGSTNGSYVNGHRVVEPADLHDGSTITMGRTRIIFRLLPTNNGGRS